MINSPKENNSTINNKFISLILILVSVFIFVLSVTTWLWSSHGRLGADEYIVFDNYFSSIQILFFSIGFLSAVIALLVRICQYYNNKSIKNKGIIRASKNEVIIIALYILAICFVYWFFFASNHGCEIVQFGDGTKGCFRGV